MATSVLRRAASSIPTRTYKVNVDVSTVPKEPLAVLQYWFGPTLAETQQDKWWGGSTTVADEVRNQFSGLVTDGMQDRFLDWELDPLPTLAKILLLDQFPRIMWRHTPLAYVGDPIAQRLARAAVSLKWLPSMLTPHQIFMVMPLLHSEKPSDHDMMFKHLDVMLRSSIGDESKDLVDFREYAEARTAVLRQFGRYPERNSVMSRGTTWREKLYLEESHKVSKTLMAEAVAD